MDEEQQNICQNHKRAKTSDKESRSKIPHPGTTAQEETSVRGSGADERAGDRARDRAYDEHPT
eukprot:9672169-Heterocapsa_arctica.AAC.1